MRLPRINFSLNVLKQMNCQTVRRLRSDTVLFSLQYHGHTVPECTNKSIVRKQVHRGSQNCFGVSVAQLQLRNLKEKDYLLSLGSDVVSKYLVMWECQWTQFKKENSILIDEIWRRSKLDPKRPLCRLTPRVSVRGGFLELYRLSYEANQCSRIHFIDANSMYSSVARDTQFPLGDYQIILEKELQTSISIKDNEIFYLDESCVSDIAHVAVLAPSDLQKPFLPYRLNNQTYYANCRSCLASKNVKPCRHKTVDKRRFVSVWTVVELNYALALGYKILYFYELYHYKTHERVLSEFVNVMASQRLKNSNILQDVPIEQQQQFCEEINAKMNFTGPLRLLPSDIKDNKALKQLFKNIANVIFGRFALHTNYSKRAFLRSQHELENLLASSSVEVLEFFPVGENTMEIEYLKNAASRASKEGCLIFTALINAKARILMHQLITKLEIDGCEALYTDTDSILFASPTNYNLPVDLGPCLGQWKYVLGESSQIKKFYSLGPRNYCLIYESDGKLNYVTKIKGLSVGSANLKSAVTPDLYETYLKDYFNGQVSETYIPQMRQSVNPQTKSFKYVMLSQKFDNELHLKRFILKNEHSHRTYSFGYNFKNM